MTDKILHWAAFVIVVIMGLLLIAFNGALLVGLIIRSPFFSVWFVFGLAFSLSMCHIIERGFPWNK